MKLIKGLYWKAYIVILACRWINSNNLGDCVIYQNKEYVLVQGVSDPVWILQSGQERVEVHASQFVKRNTLADKWHSFKSGWDFYMTSWYSIWMRTGIKDWMRNCNIWKKQS